MILVDPTLDKQWAVRNSWRPSRDKRCTHSRRRLFNAALHGAFIEPYGINETLVELAYKDDDSSKWYLAQMSFPLWWDTRVTQGHTPEAATFMLGLTVQPRWLARLAFDDTTRRRHPVFARRATTDVGRATHGATA